MHGGSLGEGIPTAGNALFSFFTAFESTPLALGGVAEDILYCCVVLIFVKSLLPAWYSLHLIRHCAVCAQPASSCVQPNSFPSHCDLVLMTGSTSSGLTGVDNSITELDDSADVATMRLEDVPVYEPYCESVALPPQSAVRVLTPPEIGRASCRERV